jgi:glycosyltransferase involved in cell wall biosynthesis
MYDKSLVSVVIPTFDSERFLRRCLDSVARQTYPYIEVIVVDNCSKDRTTNLALSLKAKVVICKGTRSEARNVGARLSQGRFILFMDSDMELGPDVIEACVYTVANDHDALIVPELSYGEGFWARCRALEKACYLGDNLIEAVRFAKKEIFESIKGYDRDLEAGEDWDLSQRIRKRGFKIGRAPAVIRHNEGCLTPWGAMKKKYQYGKTLRRYKRKHPAEASRQLMFFRSAFVRNRTRLLRQPLLAAGILFLKACEYFAAGIGHLTTWFSPENAGHSDIFGRLKVIQGLGGIQKPSLSAGCKGTRFGDVNLDVDPLARPDIVADVRFLPFREGVFGEIFFTDVLEHLRTVDESRALRQIHRSLRNGGHLIMTTPQDIRLFTLLDPAFYFAGHRHRKRAHIEQLLERNGFGITNIFAAGGWWTCINVIWYCFVTYPVRRVLGMQMPYAPRRFILREDMEYTRPCGRGYTLFVQAFKESSFATVS